MNKLFAKIYGCEAAATIANSMGDVTEGFTYEEIEKRWGFVDKMMPQNKWGKDNTLSDRVRRLQFGYQMYSHAHARPPGMTEDGQERHRLCASAIIKKGGRITIEDLAKTWVDDIKPEKFGYLLGGQDQVIYYSIKAGVPPWEVGRYAAFTAAIGTSKMILPVGCVNACNPDEAARDAHDLGRLKDVRGVRKNYALEVCAGLAAACAEALKPSATVSSVIDTALNYLSSDPLQEIKIILDWAKNANNWKDLRPLLQNKYHGHPGSNAVEVFGGGLACFYLADGHPKEAILYAVNMGRDTDCKAYVSGGLAGALRGIQELPDEWVKIIENQVVTDPYTVSTRTAKQTAKGLYEAAENTIKQYKEIVGLVDTLTGEKK